VRKGLIGSDVSQRLDRIRKCSGFCDHRHRKLGDRDRDMSHACSAAMKIKPKNKSNARNAANAKKAAYARVAVDTALLSLRFGRCVRRASLALVAYATCFSCLLTFHASFASKSTQWPCVASVASLALLITDISRASDIQTARGAGKNPIYMKIRRRKKKKKMKKHGTGSRSQYANEASITLTAGAHAR